MRHYFISLAALALLAISGPEPQWTLTDASSVQAHHSKNGVEIVANVTLKNPCWEASIIVDASGKVPAEYDVVTRTQPKKIGVMCIDQLVPTTVHAWFPTSLESVTVHTLEKAVTVKVKP